ncbi:hypothetical protein [Pseudomonas typographi]|uniref:Uncharacterized protein n=1 Tax=Pseudomonas typographi TaxID=2715964 RepID=A0ABR7YZL5_9PSED|nr:hypothetical protein [Pseudomonas typographi]MBD1586728.1 hypothetical protein [Pseudomonas typographi]MBD1598622.1 hypothetical protein [Pseudomonas typographi]
MMSKNNSVTPSRDTKPSGMVVLPLALVVRWRAGNLTATDSAVIGKAIDDPLAPLPLMSDLNVELEEEVERLHQDLGRLREQATNLDAVPAHLALYAQDMFDLLRLINVKCGGLAAVVSHGGEPSDQMWAEHDDALDAIWPLMAKVRKAEKAAGGSVRP